tara:strand:- start:530 stop:736 length:207 start_codon:yes stop_codon:yes gene_type:complete
MRLSTPQPPSGSISFSSPEAKTGRAREAAATPPRGSIDGAVKDRADEVSGMNPAVAAHKPLATSIFVT